MNQEVQLKWEECLRLLRAELTESAFATWFQSIVPVSFVDRKLVLQMRSHAVVNYIEDNYLEPFSRVLFRVFGVGIHVEYRVLIDSQSGAESPIASDRVQQATTKFEVFGPSMHDAAATPAPAEQKVPALDSRLNPNYTFESFVQGDCNHLARMVGINAAKDPGRTTFNPLFIYGGPGVGKTHLLNAIGNQVKQLYPQMRVLYLSANEFKTQYMHAAQSGHVADFLQFYQTIDVLLLDDVQFLAGANQQRTQEQFHHIFNYLHQSQKQIVLSSDRAPLEIKDLEERLLSRFKWGFQGEMGRPDFTLRKDILRNKILRDGIDLPDEVIAFIAENVRDNVRDLEGVLASLLAYSMVMNSNIDLQLAEKVIGNVVELGPSEIHIDDIIQVVCAEFSIESKLLFSKSRLKEVSMARQVAMYFAKNMTNKSLQEIGNYFGGRTHATVIHSCETVAQQMQDNPVFAHRLKKIENKLIR